MLSQIFDYFFNKLMPGIAFRFALGKLVTFVTCICFLLVVAGEDTPESPCPEIFNYEQFADDWFGKIRLDDVRLGHYVNISVIFSVPVMLSGPNRGSFDLYEDNQAAAQAIYQHKPLLLKVTFPVQNPLPSVKEIKTNNKVICIGHSGNSPEMTEFELFHIFYTRVKLQDADQTGIPLGVLTSYVHKNNIVPETTKANNN